MPSIVGEVDTRIGYLEDSLANLLGFVPDIQIATSLLVVGVVTIWMVSMIRRPDVHVRMQHQEFRASNRNRMFRPRTRKQKIARGNTGQRRVMTEHQAQTSTGSTGEFTIRWGRTGIFALSALGLITFIITGIAALFGAGTLAVALVSLGVFVVGIATLRMLAIRDQQAKQRATREETQGAHEAETDATSGTEETTGASAKETSGTTATNNVVKVFDAQQVAGEKSQADTAHSPTEDLTQQIAQLTVTELDETLAGQESTTGGKKKITTDNTATFPRVPEPTYRNLAEIQRPVPEALEVVADPQPSADVKLRDGVSEQYQAKLTAKAHRRLDLDKVLNNRRRAM